MPSATTATEALQLLRLIDDYQHRQDLSDDARQAMLQDLVNGAHRVRDLVHSSVQPVIGGGNLNDLVAAVAHDVWPPQAPPPPMLPHRHSGSGASSSSAGTSSADTSSNTSPVGTPAPASAIKPPRKKRSPQQGGARTADGRCQSCHTNETPEWRRGPMGARTLCNACGLVYSKMKRKERLLAGGGGGGHDGDLLAADQPQPPPPAPSTTNS